MNFSTTWLKTHPACFAGTPLSSGEFFTSKFCINSPLYQEGIQGCVRLSILNSLREIHKRPGGEQSPLYQDFFKGLSKIKLNHAIRITKLCSPFSMNPLQAF